MIFSITDEQAPVAIDPRHPTYRANPPPRAEIRQTMKVGTKVVEYNGALPTPEEIETFEREQATKQAVLLAKSNGEALAKRQIEEMAKTDPIAALLQQGGLS